MVAFDRVPHPFPGRQRNSAKFMHRQRLLLSSVVVVSSMLTGCMEGPLRLGYYNPWLREEWKKDEQYGPLLHDKLDELAALRSGVSRLTPQEQKQRSQELLHIMRNERNTILIAEIVRTLAVFPTEESLEALRMASMNGDSDIRVAACHGWAIKGGQEAIETLAQTLGSDTDNDVRIAAAHGLEKFRDPMAVRALGTALEANDPALQFRAVQSLKLVTGQDYGDSVPAWREFVQSGQAKPAASSSIASKLLNWF